MTTAPPSPPSTRVPRGTRRLAGHADSVTAAAFGERGGVLATGGEVRRREGRCLQQHACCGVASLKTHRKQGANRPPFSLPQDGALLLHDLRSPSPATVLLPPTSDPIASLAWQRPDADVSTSLLAVGVGCGVVLVDARRAAQTTPPSFTTTDDVAGVAFAADSSTLAIVDDMGAATVASVSPTGGLRVDAALRNAHTSLASAAAWRPGSARHLVTAGLDCTIALWDVTARRCTARWRAGAGVEGQAEVTQVVNPPFVHALAVSPVGTAGVTSRLVAAACGDCAVLLLDARSGSGRRGSWDAGPPDPLARLTPAAGGHTSACTALAFVQGTDATPAAPRILASGGDDGRVLLWAWRAAVARASPPSAWRDTLTDTPADAPALVADIAHGHKVQALAAGREGVVAVCDVGVEVTVCEVGV